MQRFVPQNFLALVLGTNGSSSWSSSSSSPMMMPSSSSSSSIPSSSSSSSSSSTWIHSSSFQSSIEMIDPTPELLAESTRGLSESEGTAASTGLGSLTSALPPSASDFSLSFLAFSSSSFFAHSLAHSLPFLSLSRRLCGLMLLLSATASFLSESFLASAPPSFLSAASFFSWAHVSSQSNFSSLSTCLLISCADDVALSAPDNCFCKSFHFHSRSSSSFCFSLTPEAALPLASADAAHAFAADKPVIPVLVKYFGRSLKPVPAAALALHAEADFGSTQVLGSGNCRTAAGYSSRHLLERYSRVIILSLPSLSKPSNRSLAH